MQNIGYARVSTIGQGLDTQKEILKEKGCAKIFEEKETGTSTDKRKALSSMIDYARSGDTIYITKIDRLARSIIDLNKIVKTLNDKGVNVVFIQDQLHFNVNEKNTPIQDLMFNMLGSFAQFERDLIVDRTTEGRERAKAKGVHMGRPKSSTDKQVDEAIRLMNDRENNNYTVAEICRLTTVKRATLYAKMKEYNKSKGEKEAI